MSMAHWVPYRHGGRTLTITKEEIMKEAVAHLRELKKGEVEVGMYVRVANTPDCILCEGWVTEIYPDNSFKLHDSTDGGQPFISGKIWEFDTYLVHLLQDLELPSAQHKQLPPKSEWTDKHYNYHYTLTPEDIAAGKIKIDPYFVNMLWGVNDADKTGAAFHCLKTITRMARNKNTLAREWDAMVAQSTRARQLMGSK